MQVADPRKGKAVKPFQIRRWSSANADADADADADARDLA